ncbi:MAG: hypothetical protein Kow0037_12490 [Calditrichia bacterium]
MTERDGIQIETTFIDENGEIMLIKLGGYIDQANVHILQSTIDNCIDSNCFKVVFDMQNLVYMSSAGWGVLIGEIKRFRENNGDMKLINMGPTVYEIYRMLEFYHIMKEYPTLTDAVKDFDRQVKIKAALKEEKQPSATQDATKVLKFTPKKEEETPLLSKEVSLEPEGTLETKETRNTDFIPFTPKPVDTVIELERLPLPEKIKAIVAKYPHFSAWKIKKMLRHEEFGKTKVGYFKVRKLLKELDLDTKAKRYRYYRSC